MNKYLLLTPLAVLIGALIPWRRTRWHGNEHLIRQMPRHRFQGLREYLEENPALCPGQAFWDSSGGLRGILRRFREMTVLVRILQHEVSCGRVSRLDATQVWKQAALQLWFSAWAIPEALICKLWSQMPHVNGMFALRSHWQLTLQTVNLCGNEDAPVYMGLLIDLL